VNGFIQNASAETRGEFCVDRGGHLHAVPGQIARPMAFICEANGRGAFHPFNQPADG
jgi:hypothetical protein